MGKILRDSITSGFCYGYSLQSIYPKGLNYDFTDHLNFGILQLLEFEFAQTKEHNYNTF